MGANLQKTTNNIVNEVITDQSSTFINETSVRRDQDINASQEMDFRLFVGGDMIGCSSNFRQDLVIKADIVDELDSTKTTQLANSVNIALKNDVATQVEQMISGLPIATANKSEIINDVSTYSFTDMSTTVANALSSNINNAVKASQKQKIEIDIRGNLDCRTGGEIYVGQTLDISAIIESTLKEENVQKVVNDFSMKIDNAIASSTTQKIAGLDPFAFITMVVIGGIIGLCLIIGLPVFFTMKAKKAAVSAVSGGSGFGLRRRIRR